MPMDLVYPLSNLLVGLAFAWLLYRTICIVAAAWGRSRQLRTEARQWDELCGVLERKLSPLAKAVRQGRVATQAALAERLGRLCKAVQELRGGQPRLPAWAQAPAVLGRTLRLGALGRHDLAAAEREDWLGRMRFGVEHERLWGGRALRLGLLGTVLGSIAAFGATGAGDPLARLQALSFALLTTAAGLVLAILIEVALNRLFEPALEDLERRSGRTSRRLAVMVDELAGLLRMQQDGADGAKDAADLSAGHSPGADAERPQAPPPPPSCRERNGRPGPNQDACTGDDDHETPAFGGR